MATGGVFVHDDSGGGGGGEDVEGTIAVAPNPRGDGLSVYVEGDADTIGEVRNALVRAETDARIAEEVDAQRRAEQLQLPTEFELPPAWSNNIDMTPKQIVNVLNNNGGTLHVNSGGGGGIMKTSKIPSYLQANVQAALKERNTKDMTIAANPDINEEKRVKLMEQRMSEVLTADLSDDMPDASLLYQLYSYAMNTDPSHVVSSSADRENIMNHKRLFGRHTMDVLYGDTNTAMTALSEYMHEQMPAAPVIIQPPTNPRVLDPWRGTKKSIQRSIYSKLQRLGNKWMRSVGADASNQHIKNIVNAKLRAMADVFARGSMGDPAILNSVRHQRPPHPSRNRKLRAMANIIRPQGCNSGGPIRAVRLTDAQRRRSRQQQEPSQQGGSSQEEQPLQQEEDELHNNNLALVDVRTGTPISTLAELNAVLASADPATYNVSHLAYPSNSSGGIAPLLRGPSRMSMSNTLGTFVGDDIADAYTRRMYGKKRRAAAAAAGGVDDDFEYLLNDENHPSVEADVNYLFGSRRRNDQRQQQQQQHYYYV